MNRIRTFILQKRNENPDRGFTVAEVMISAIIILIVVVSSAYGITSAIKSSVYVENAAKANQVANQQIALAKQAPFRQLWVARTSPATNLGLGKCVDPVTSPAKTGTSWATAGLMPKYKDLDYCTIKRFGQGEGVGTTFYVTTTVAYINNATAFDASSTLGTTPTNYRAKRVIVTVVWKDVAAGEGYHTIQQTYTRTPNLSECIPDTITSTGANLLTGCRP